MAAYHFNGLICFILVNLLCLYSVVRIIKCDNTPFPHEATGQQEVEVRQSPSHIFILRNSPLTLNCGVSIPHNTQVLEFWWLKDGHRVQNLSRIKYSNLDLSFDKVVVKAGRNISDEGRYRCLVRLEFGVVIGPITRLSIVALDVRITDSFVRGVIGQNVLLDCGINAVPLGTATWTRVGGGGTLGSRYKLLTSGNLLITNLAEEDAGSFRCTMANPELQAEKTSTLHLTTHFNTSHFGPKILDTFATQLTLTTNSINLLCVANGNPRPSLKWIVSFELDNEVRTQEVSLEAQISLSKENITGNYSCVASNNGLQVTRSVHTYHAPSFPNLPVQSSPAAKTVRLECRSEAATLWYKDGVIIHPNKGRIKKKNYELVISNTIQTDSGFYQCESEDWLGTGRVLITLPIEDLQAPVQLGCTSMSSREVLVRWKLTSGANVQAFTVHYMPVEGGEERQKVTNILANSLLIDTLLPNTNYSIYVRSYSGRSASGQSEKVFCPTLEDYPSTTPELTIFDQLGPPTQYRLKWTRLKPEEARGKIVLYKLQWRAQGDNFNNVQFLHGDSQEFIITGLQASSSYSVRLLPATSLGMHPRRNEFPWTSIRTGNSTRDFSGPKILINFVNSSAVGVAWESNTANGDEITGYRLFLGEENARLGEIIHQPVFELERGRTNFTFSGLAPATQYQVSVQSFGENWESELAVKNIKTTNGNTSVSAIEFSTITGLSAVPQSPTEVVLSWFRPKTDDIDFFVIRYSAVDSEASSFLESESEPVLIRDLKPYTTYEFAVGYHVNGLPSLFSQKVETMTMEGLPGPPVSPQFQVLNKSSIQVTWQRPLQSNGLITRYVVEFTNSSAAPSLLHSNSSSLIIINLQPNKVYVVRVAAETKAGVGLFSSVLSPKIFTSPPEKSSSGGMIQDSPGSNATSTFLSGATQQQLGLILGSALALTSIVICSSIIIWRNRCFSFLVRRSRRAAFLNGRPEGKDLVDSAPVEMKVLNAIDHSAPLDTKGGHPNGVARDEVCQPLLVRVSSPVAAVDD